MITKVRKRDGREVPFNIEKISNAIFKAAQAVGGQDYETSMDLAEEVARLIKKDYPGDIPSVEDIQDSVEKVLIEAGHARTAKEYILYRAERTKARDMNTRLMKVFEDLTFKEEAKLGLLSGEIDGRSDTAMATMLSYGSESAKEFYDLFILNPEHSKAHKSGDIHIHDLEFLTLTSNSCQIDLRKLLNRNFSKDYAHLRRPDDIASYAALTCIAIHANQNDQHGGQSIADFDYGMADGVRKSYIRNYRENLKKAIELLINDINLVDNLNNIFRTLEEDYDLLPKLGVSQPYRKSEAEYLGELLNNDDLVGKIQSFAEKNAYDDTDRESYRAMEGLLENLNTVRSRPGAEIPSSTINYGTDISEEGRMIMKNLLLASGAGLANGKKASYPVQIFKLKEGINYNEGDPNYDIFKLACKLNLKGNGPNFAFIDADFNKIYYKEGRPETEIAYMGSRHRLIENIHDPDRRIVSSRGNLSYTSINLPRLALRNKGDLDSFFIDLDRTINLTVAQLLERFEIQASKKAFNYPFLMGQELWLDSESLYEEDEIREILKHGSLSLGYVGLAECLKGLVGYHHGESDKAQVLGLKIVKHMRDRMDDISNQYRMNFNLLATDDGEYLWRFAGLDREKYGNIDGITDKGYYTNSFHIPNGSNLSNLEKIQKEAPYHALSNGGHLSRIEIDGNPDERLRDIENIIRYMKDYGMGYVSLG